MNIGTVKRIQLENVVNLANFFSNQKQATDFIIANIDIKGQVTNTANMFANCTSLESISSSTTPFSEYVTDMSGMFYGASSFSGKGLQYLFSEEENASSWGKYNRYANNVVNASHMFTDTKLTYAGTSFNLNMPKIQDISYMFAYSSIAGNDNSTPFDLYINSNTLVNTSHMFESCHELTGIDFIQGSNIWRSVKDASYMFANSEHFNGYASFYNLTNGSHMCDGCTLANGRIYINSKQPGLDMSYAFRNILHVNFEQFQNMRATNMSHMLDNAAKDLFAVEAWHDNGINCNYAKDLSFMFANNPGVTNNKCYCYDFNNATNMNGIFENCPGLSQNFVWAFVNNIPLYNNMVNVNGSKPSNTLDYFGLTESQIKMMKNNLPAANKAIANGWSVPTTVNYKVYYKTDTAAAAYNAIEINDTPITSNGQALRDWLVANNAIANNITNLKVEYNGLPDVTNMSRMFSNSTYNLNNSLQSVDEMNLPGVTNLNSIMNRLVHLTTLNGFNAPDAVDLGNAFPFCTNLTSITNFHVGNNVESVYNMFCATNNLKEVPLFNTSLVTNFSRFLSSMYLLENVPNYDTSNGINFQNAVSTYNNQYSYGQSWHLTTMPFWNTASGQQFDSMFENQMALVTLPNFNMNGAIHTSNMLHCCENLTSFLPRQFNKVISSAYMFRKCKSLTHIDDLHMNNTAYTNEMFAYCNNLISVNNMIFNNIRSMSGMFQNCSNLVHLSGVLNSNKTEYIRNLITNCPKLSNDSLNFIAYSLPYFDNITDSYKAATLDYVGFTQDQINNLSMAAIDRVEERGWFARPQIKVTLTSQTNKQNVYSNKFYIDGLNGQQQYTNLLNLLVDFGTAWNNFNSQGIGVSFQGTTNNITNLCYLFMDVYQNRGFSMPNIVQVNFKMNTGSVINMHGVCYSLYNVSSIEGLNFYSATDMGQAFAQDYNFHYNPSIQGTNFFNCPNVVDASACLQSTGIIDIGNINMPKVHDVSFFFQGCSNLTNIDVSNIKMPNVTNMMDFVEGCENLTVTSLQNLMIFIPEVTQLDNCTTETNLNYLGLTQNQINNIPAKYLQLAADKHWNIPGYKARIKKDIIPMLNNLGVFTQITGTNKIPMDIKYETNLGTNALVSNIYGKDYYESGMILNITQDVYDNYGPTLMTQLWYSSEKNYDYIYINKVYTNGTEKRILNNISGTQSGSETYPVLNMPYDLDINVGEQIKFIYRKDSSAKSGADMAMVQIFGMVEPNESYSVKYTYANGISQTKNFE